MSGHAPSNSTELPTQAGVRRTLLMAAGGAVVGLAIAGFGLFTAKGTSTLMVPAEDVALVNQQPISRIDYIALLQTMYSTDLAHATAAQKQRVLSDMIQEELQVQRGKELDVTAVDPQVRTAVVASVEQQAAMPAFTNKPNEQNLRAFFEAHRETYSSEGVISLHDLLFADIATADEAAAALRSGQTVVTVLQKFRGRDTDKVKGEDFYFAARIHLGDVLFTAAQSLPSGTVSGAIPTEEGVHVLAVARNAPPVLLSYDAIRARVADDYRRDATGRLQATNRDFLRKRANVLISEDMR
jgi:parvulin-like peptidyl-prolyl isomerase